MHSQNRLHHRDNRPFTGAVFRRLLWVLAVTCMSVGCAASQTGPLSSPDLKPTGAYSFQSRTNLLTNHMALQRSLIGRQLVVAETRGLIHFNAVPSN